MIDLLIVALMVLYAYSGFRNGAAVSALSLGGFVLGAVVAMKLVPLVAGHLPDGVGRSLGVLGMVAAVAWGGQLVGSLVGSSLSATIPPGPLRLANSALGAVAGVISVAVVAWFVGGALRDADSPVVARAVSSSSVLQTIDGLMPSQLSSIADGVKEALSNSDFPKVFSGLAPEQILPVSPPDSSMVSSALKARIEASTVKVTGDAAECSRGQEGSGAVVAKGRVVTNAHVVAGVRSPSVQVGGQGRKYPAQVVLFDPSRDIAVLSVPGLTAPALAMGTDLSRSDSAVVAGFPRNGPYTVVPARVRSVIQASGEDIYGRPGVVRSVYSLYAVVQPGNSGGPLVSPQGRFVGLVFAKSLDDPQTGYALTVSETTSDIKAGVAATAAVSTRGCTSG